MASSELVESLVTKHIDHFIRVVRAERIEHEAFGDELCALIDLVHGKPHWLTGTRTLTLPAANLVRTRLKTFT